MRHPAIAWFTRRNYTKHRALDPAGLPVAFDDWEFRANQQFMLSNVKLRVVIDPGKFSAWCRAQGRDANASARNAFAQVVAANGRSRGWWRRRGAPR
jgi:hypothetical protein